MLLVGGLLDESAFLEPDVPVGGVGRLSSASVLRVARVLHAETIRSNKLGSSEDSTIDVVREQSKFKDADTHARYVEQLKMGRREDVETIVG